MWGEVGGLKIFIYLHVPFFLFEKTISQEYLFDHNNLKKMYMEKDEGKKTISKVKIPLTSLPSIHIFLILKLLELVFVQQRRKNRINV